MTKKKTEDLLDDFFDEIEKDSYSFKQTSNFKQSSSSQHSSSSKHSSINDFEEKVKKTINDTVNSEGFKNVANLFNDGILSIKKNFIEDDIPLFNFEVKEMDTRLDYVKNTLNNLKFDVFHRGQYKEGYHDALDYFMHQMEVSKYNLLDMESEVKKAMKAKRYKQIKRSDRYYEGYAEGLKFLKETLYNSKIYMMNKIKEDIK